MFAYFRRYKAYRKGDSQLNDAGSHKRLMMDDDSEHSSPRPSGESTAPLAGWQKTRSRTGLFVILTSSLAITNIVTLGLWIGTLHRMSSWLMDDYYNRPGIEYLGQAQAPVEYESRRFHTGIVNDDVTEFFGAPGTKADMAWNRVLDTGLMRLTADQASRLGDETAREWNTTDSYVGILGTFHQLHCLSRLRYTLFFPDRYEEFDGDRLANKHILHCIEYLRQIIMCLGDVTIEPVGWNETTLSYIAEKHEVPNAPGNEKAWQDMLRFKNAHPVDHSRGGG
ncbi:hypothetical protein E0Z10_g7340 [Xylaria hypoxylon]|uniref:Tat pathway signal sequence n=1 Tax=Xylaria hypoxylon TaxID=37992 RepID=A0A4Z0YQW6_9PEZI|nr:hypothetical protein E0Z10_g7340 [Xylaria hypoxylon]